MPRWVNRKLRSTPLAAMYADVEVLDQFTNGFDRILAIIFYSLFLLSSFACIALVIFSAIGFFD